MPRYSIYLVGSTISGFGLDTSDVDMCLVSRCITSLDSRSEAVMHLSRLGEYLQQLSKPALRTPYSTLTNTKLDPKPDAI